MKSSKTKTKRRRAVPENGSARAPVSKTAKTKPKKRLDERPSRTTLKSRRVIEERLTSILATIENIVWSIAAYTYETFVIAKIACHHRPSGNDWLALVQADVVIDYSRGSWGLDR